MSLEILLDKVRSYNPEGDLESIERAYKLAKESHQGQLRNSGEEFFIHPYNVALLLAEIHMDVPTIISGLLHDVIEDTDMTFDEVKDMFGEDVANLVDGVTKLTKMQFKTKEEHKAENLRKMVIAMAKDIRVIIIKLTDRLHNMRTLEYMSEEKKKEKATETLEIYAPLANRLGIHKLKWELEDLSLRYIDSDGYYKLVKMVSAKRKEREAQIKNIMDSIKEKLDEMGIEDYEVSGRPKNFYSIYRKMKYQNKEFAQIFDLTAVRVTVNTIKDCYGVLGSVHTMWKPIPGRFKDYIAMPKANMYQSLHTTVIGPQGDRFEVQIRTYDMHRTAEYGIAAHWKYKEGTNKEDKWDRKLVWLRQMMEWQDEVKDPKEFMDSLKGDLFTDEVFVFTPKGDVVNLPGGSTPIDFAYRVHTAVGNKCVGAKVDGRIVPLDYKLKTGNIIDVLTSANSKGPSRDWLKIVKSNQAKSRIKQFFKKEERDVNIVNGKDKVEKEVKRQGYKLTEMLKDDWLNKIAEKLNFRTQDDLYAAIGYGSITISQVMPKLKSYYNEYYSIEEEEEEKVEVVQKPQEFYKVPTQGVSVKGIDNIKVKFARCCNPVPGDRILGYVTKGRGVSIHREDCPNVKNESVEEMRFIDVEWNVVNPVSFEAEIQVKAVDSPGLLTKLTQLLTDSNLMLSSLNARKNKEKLALINLTLEIKNIEQLEKLMNKIRVISGVMDVYRVIS